MDHYTHEEWLAYINNNLPKATHSELEDHLYSCDQCLELYMEQIDNQTEQLPEIENINFTDELVSKIHFEKTKKSNPFYKHAIFHYGLAAAVTFLLMSSGFFQGITGFVSTVEASSFTEKEESFSDNLMDKTLQLLDIVLPKKE
ncbi:hypothetical protein PY093_20250 [Cytobacillus sp. S13-E01]|uniref:anti-sigma factor family protein n=1 Tax=Cytobacillus sp. S13-E01 TaxID=3031326 RepID=UPI0023D80023|nr:hypothetical protein [Cytobacillus sp. S13-E01]MDF0728948.1 hypothetical protein [Cytobacillus sp. S13-E01]